MSKENAAPKERQDGNSTSLIITYDGTIAIALGRSRKDINWKNREMRWSEFLNRISRTHRTVETLAEYLQLPKGEQDEIKDVGGFVGGTLKGGRRLAEAVGMRHIVTLDADFVKEDLWFLIGVLGYFACAMYSTHKHSPENPRLRIVFPLSRPVTPDEYQAIARRIAADFGIDQFDDTTYQPQRLMYWPSAATDGEYIFHHLDAPWLDPDSVLARYPDWRDASFWPTSSRTQPSVLDRLAKKQEDPSLKDNIVGVLCRTYSISDTIATILPDVYEPCSHDDRYTYIGGSTAGGLVVYNEDKFAYSHHGTDPTSGKLVNAFDLIRIHKYGHMDDDVKPGTPSNRMPSYMAMVEFCEQDERVQETKRQERWAAIEEDFAGDVKVSPYKLFFEEKRFIPKYMAQWFLSQHRSIVLQEDLYIYDSGRYVDGDRIFREKGTRALDLEFSARRLMEALQYLKNTVRVVAPDEAASMGRYLNLRNGLLNLETLEFEPHAPELHTVVQLPVEYDPTAQCPAIDQYLTRVLPEDCIPVVEEMLGYCLLPTMKYEKSFLFYGEGGNGKGTLIALMEALIGGDNTSNVALQALTENRFLSAELFGKLANLHADIPNRFIEDSSLFKELTSGDMLQAERKHKTPFKFRNRAKLIFSANELPSSRDNSDGFHRRWIVIPFPNKFTDEQLRRRLFEQRELSGLLLRAISGIQRLREQGGFSMPETIRQTVQAYREKSDSVFRFLTERCEADSKGFTGKQELYEGYRYACRDWGMQPVNQANFNGKIRTVYPDVTEYKTNGPRKWKGLIVLSPFTFAASNF